MGYLGSIPKSTTFYIDVFSGDNSTTSFVMREAVAATSSIMVFVGGIRQNIDSYYLSGRNIIFTEAPPTGTNNIQIVYLGLFGVSSVPSDLSVTDRTIAANSITSVRLTTTGVSAGLYGGASNVSSFTVDAQGRITSASNVAIETGFNPFLLSGM
jgi:hypothetical protein